MEAYHAANALRLRGAANDRRDWRRLEQNTICGVVRARSWRSRGRRTDMEFDVAWRVIFGGMTSVMTERIDHPEHGFRWRGERMEWAFARALHLIASDPEA